MTRPDAALRPPDPVASPAPTTPSTSAGLLVESEREVTVEGAVVEVLETSRLVEGATVQVAPPAATPFGLELLTTVIVTPEGRTAPLTDPVTLTPEGAITVRGRYRLTACPDVLPTQWPSPADFLAAARSYLRLDEPQHTARALCANARSDAGRLKDLRGVVATGGQPRLIWNGDDVLRVDAVGSASGVAVAVVNPVCDGTCVVRIPAGGGTLLQLQTVDPCPPATTDDSLVLVASVGDQPSRIVAVEVPGLHRTLCR
jgi:hypothetical protein